MLKRKDFDLIVIGSGAGGGVGASLAASRGKRVAMFEKEAVGGECPNFACVPTKALLHAAENYDIAKNSSQYGVRAKEVSFDYREVKKWKDLVVSRTGTAEGSQAFTSEGIKFFQGEARFISPHTIVAGGREYSAKRFLIGTGSYVFIPPIPGLESGDYITYREAVDFFRPPKSIFILGGGAIGCEFAQIFSTFGSKVHIAESLPRLLGREDKEVGELVGALFQDRGVNVLTGATVTKVVKRSGGKEVHYQSHGKDHSVTVDEVLVATGKRPVVNLDLEKAGVRYDKGGIKVNQYLQTTQPHIYAAGDVVGPYLFTHTAEHQSAIAAHNAFSRKKLKPNYLGIARCVFTIPEVASVGLSEDQAREKGIRVRVGAAPIMITGRANTSNENNGFVKVLTDEKGTLIGGSIVSPRAGEMIHELALAIHLRVKASTIADMVHAFPTYSEAIKFACASVQ